MVALATLIGARRAVGSRCAPIDFSLPGTSRVLIGAVVLAVLYSLAGLGVGTIVRSQPLAIVVIVIWPLLIEGIFGGIFPSVGKWLPFLAAGRLLTINPREDVLNPWVGAAVPGRRGRRAARRRHRAGPPPGRLTGEYRSPAGRTRGPRS